MPGRIRSAGGGRLALLAGIVVALLAAVALSIGHHPARPAVAPRIAIAAAMRNPAVAQARAGSHWDRVTATAIDGKLVHVSYLTHGQLVAEAAIDRTGHVLAAVNDRHMAVPYGNWIAYEPAVLAALCALFVLMAGVTPWRRLRNLDVAAMLAFLPAVVLFQHRYLSDSMLAASPVMVYMLLRCAFTAFGPACPAQPARPLLVAITPGLDPARRVRCLRWLLLMLVFVFVMVGVGSPDAVDVLYAAMEGATKLIHGILPYGHLPPGVIHGDTYPILSYVLYVPIVLFAPVSSTWDSVTGGLAVAMLAALIATAAVFRMTAGRRPAGSRRPAEVEEAGLRAALTWLAFPPLLIIVSTGTTDPILAAMLAVAVLLWRRPGLCTGMLAVAGWFKLAPFALVPVALAPLRGRRLAASLAAVGVVSLPLLALLFALGGLDGPREMLHAMSYQFSRGSEQSVWSALGIPGAQPLSQAGVLGLLAGSVVLLRREPQLAADRRRMAALCGAILIGLQLSADYWAFLYLAWVTPLIGCSVLSESPAAEAAREQAALTAGHLEAAGALAA